MRNNTPRPRGTLFALMFIVSAIVVTITIVFTALLIRYRVKDLVANSDAQLLMATELAKVNAIIRETVVTSCVVGIVVACGSFLFVLVLSRRFTAPVAKLTEIAERMASGDFDAPMATSDIREFQNLADALDRTRREMKRLIAESRTGEAHLRSIIDNFLAGMIYQVVLTPDGSKKFTYLSDSIRRLYGVSPAEGMADASLLYSRIHEDDIEALLAAEREAVKTFSTFKAEVRVKEPSGKIRWSSIVSTPRLLDDGSTRFDGIEFVITERKLAEEALLNSELRYRMLLKSATIGIAVSNMDGEETLINPACAEMLGVAAKKITARALVELTHPEDREKEASLFAEMTKGERRSYNMEKRYVRGDGKVIWAFETVSMVFAKTGEPLFSVAFMSDITERKRVEAELKASERNYREIFNAINDAIFIHDSKTGAILDVNLAMEEMFQYTREEVLRLDVGLLSQGTAPYSQKEAESWIHKASTEGPQLFEWLDRKKDGTLFWVEMSLKSIVIAEQPRIIAMARDITERKRAAEAIENRERFLNSVIEQSPFATWIYDMDGVIRRANPALLKTLGLTEARLVGAYNVFKDPNIERQGLTPLVRSVFEEGKTVHFTARWRGENIPVPGDKSDNVIDIEATMFPIFDAANKITNVVLHWIDISDRLRAEAEKEKLQSQLIQAQKMESVGRLAGGVAHDFNNMLSVIFGNVELALKRMTSGKPHITNLQEIRKAAQRSADLTRQLLAFARRQTVEPKALNLNDAVTGMLKMLRQLMGEDINLIWEPAPDLWLIKIDPSQVDQILVNLCVNSRDAIAGVGKVTIETNNRVFDADYCAAHPGFVPGEYVLLTVSDNGCGIEKETLAHIFEPFFTTKNMGKGTGLGLSTVYGVVKQNNGFINLYSEPGRGTTFAIYLPRHANTPQQPQVERPLPTDLRGSETILLVEDEPAILCLIRDILKELGYHILSAGTPGEAFRLAQEHAGEIQLLLTDVVMPEMSGRDLAKNLLISHPRLKCLFMSGYTANVIAHHGVLDEGVQFIQKPFSIHDLAAKIKKALGTDA